MFFLWLGNSMRIPNLIYLNLVFMNVVILVLLQFPLTHDNLFYTFSIDYETWSISFFSRYLIFSSSIFLFLYKNIKYQCASNMWLKSLSVCRLGYKELLSLFVKIFRDFISIFIYFILWILNICAITYFVRFYIQDF